MNITTWSSWSVVNNFRFVLSFSFNYRDEILLSEMLGTLELYWVLEMKMIFSLQFS